MNAHHSSTTFEKGFVSRRQITCPFSPSIALSAGFFDWELLGKWGIISQRRVVPFIVEVGEVTGKRGKRGKRAKLSSGRAEHIVPAAQVLQGARGVHFNDCPVTVAGRDVNNVKNVKNVVNNAYYNTPGNAATKDADDGTQIIFTSSIKC
ncbi:hypothetical protein FA15DRAFT_698515 [Coprinopsis marcescibilis]|uniref:Uncharacterized protein n=1 Tax=Coprinopsis marcescibilis TaxID=230819 RepID=A0A5C3KAW4_COPMA|nr:hypothetical protein FA15DRAFT_698515 [Coprinopsis marcescibilis]